MHYLEDTLGKFDRIYYLIEYLANLSTGLTVEDMAEETGKHEKTVRRDLESIQAIFGLDLLKERGPDRKYRYRIEKHAVPFRPLILNIDEIISLYFIRGFAHFKDVSLVHKNINELFKKIKLESVEANKRSGNNFHERVCDLFILPKELGGKVYNEEVKIDLLPKLIEAAIDLKNCEITYGSGESNNKYKIAPLHFFNYRDAIYILTKNIELSNNYSKNIFTNFAMHRIKSIKVLDQHFEYPTDLDLKKHFKSGSFNFADEVHNIKLKFPARTREYILEREWYPNQTSKVQKDGSLILEFESDLNLIVQGWIRGFGPDVEVLEPKELRKTIISDLKKNLKQY
jgi:predicted DNA-binding transcriptional regulator YafY